MGISQNNSIDNNITLDPHEEELLEMVEKLKNSKNIHDIFKDPFDNKHSFNQPNNQMGGSENSTFNSYRGRDSVSKKATKIQNYVENMEFKNALPEKVNQMSTFKKFKLISWSILFFVALAFFTVKFYFPFHAEYVQKIIIQNPSLKDKVIGDNVDSKIVMKLFRDSAAKFIKLEEIKEQFSKYLSIFSLSSIHTKIVGNVNTKTTATISSFDQPITHLNLLKSFIGKATSLGFTTQKTLKPVVSSILPQIPFFTYHILKSTGLLVKNVVSYTAPPVFKGSWFLTKASFNLMFNTIEEILYKNSLQYHHNKYHKLLNKMK